MSQPQKTALFLAGGGARAAYQIGVLQAIFSLLSETGWPTEKLPFHIICGTSAGALNAAALASRADDFEESVSVLLRIWRELEVEQVYRADSMRSRRTRCSTIRRWSACCTRCWTCAGSMPHSKPAT